jgi:transglutaminase-like putative cysteine protease
MDRSDLLKATYFLDHDHPRVSAFATSAVAGARSDGERAAKLFTAVRDGVRYDPYGAVLTREGLTASAALDRGAGFCVPKAILLAAALRAVGIPTRLGFCDVENHLATPRLLELLRTRVFVFHGYVEVHLGNRVLKATPAFNATLCARFGVAPLEFDGEHDAMLQAFDGRGHGFMKYVTERGTFDDFPYDEMLRVWREFYPHLFGNEPTGDFEAEASASRV